MYICTLYISYYKNTYIHHYKKAMELLRGVESKVMKPVEGLANENCEEQMGLFALEKRR